ncbi:hypothetical protein C8T65DRAFT_279012 [Cerioporus squamosus]|nr:hypothetical protein C8T65DRAFT_279012 [Cerioporus squamosus]
MGSSIHRHGPARYMIPLVALGLTRNPTTYLHSCSAILRMSFDASELEIIFANNCFAVAALALICYDCVFTLAKEVSYIWTRRRLTFLRPPGLIYLFVRHTSLVGQIVLVIHLEPWKPVGSAEKCLIAVHIGDAMNVVNGLACAVLTVLRAYALSHRVAMGLLVALPCLLNPALFMAEAIGIRVLPIDTLGLDQCVGVLGSQSLASSARNSACLPPTPPIDAICTEPFERTAYLATTITASTGDIMTCTLAIYTLGFSFTPSRTLWDALRWDASMGLLTLAVNMLVNLVLVLVFDKVYKNPAMILFFRAWAILYPVFDQYRALHTRTARALHQD